MSGLRGTVLALALAGAFATNPDDQSFVKFYASMTGVSGTLGETLTSIMSRFLFKRKDYKFFSVVTVPDQEDVWYLGIYGTWIALPAMSALTAPSDSRRLH